MKDPDVGKKIDYAHAIMHMFQYNYKDQWVPQAALIGRDRLWTQTFNELVKKGIIERKKTFFGYQYRWKAKFP
ncbi:MAG: hypothetical protein QXK37_01640 [Candidatus Woesearchaeota archaeon]